MRGRLPSRVVASSRRHSTGGRPQGRGHVPRRRMFRLRRRSPALLLHRAAGQGVLCHARRKDRRGRARAAPCRPRRPQPRRLGMLRSRRGQQPGVRTRPLVTYTLADAHSGSQSAMPPGSAAEARARRLGASRPGLAGDRAAGVVQAQQTLGRGPAGRHRRSAVVSRAAAAGSGCAVQSAVRRRRGPGRAGRVEGRQQTQRRPLVDTRRVCVRTASPSRQRHSCRLFCPVAEAQRGSMLPHIKRRGGGVCGARSASSRQKQHLYSSLESFRGESRDDRTRRVLRVEVLGGLQDPRRAFGAEPQRRRLRLRRLACRRRRPRQRRPAT